MGGETQRETHEVECAFGELVVSAKVRLDERDGGVVGGGAGLEALDVCEARHVSRLHCRLFGCAVEGTE